MCHCVRDGVKCEIIWEASAGADGTGAAALIEEANPFDMRQSGRNPALESREAEQEEEPLEEAGGSEQVAGGLEEQQEQQIARVCRETEAGDSVLPRFANYMLISQKILRFTLMAWRAPRYMQLFAQIPVISGL